MTTAFETFQTLVQTPINARHLNARGLVAPLLRSYGHILFLLACAGTPNVTLTDLEIRNELSAAYDHLGFEDFPGDLPISLQSTNYIEGYKATVAGLSAGYFNWTDEERTVALSLTAHSAASIAAALDREFTGLSPVYSDPGTSL